jgi:hypothetical protein
MDITSIVGYSASIVLIISFMLKDITKLRIVNTVGCALFVAYGYLLDVNWPIIIPNVFIMGVNVYHLMGAQKKKETGL